MKKILGIDPGFGRMGWAVLEVETEPRLVAYGCIETDVGDEHAVRLATIANEVRAILEVHRPSTVAIEQLLFTKNQTTGLKVAEARGVALAIAGAFYIQVVEVGPMQVKLAVTGNGHADKMQVMDMVRRLLHLNDVPKPDDAADACAIAWACINMAKK